MLHIAAAETKRQQVLPAKISTKAQILVSFDTCADICADIEKILRRNGSEWMIEGRS